MIPNTKTNNVKKLWNVCRCQDPTYANPKKFNYCQDISEFLGNVVPFCLLLEVSFIKLQTGHLAMESKAVYKHSGSLGRIHVSYILYSSCKHHRIYTNNFPPRPLLMSQVSFCVITSYRGRCRPPIVQHEIYISHKFWNTYAYPLLRLPLH